MKVIRLNDLFGDFCTERAQVQKSMLKSEIKETMAVGKLLSLDRSDVKLMTTSFIDELLSDFAADYGVEKVLESVLFDPPLEEIYLNQIRRGAVLRAKS